MKQNQKVVIAGAVIVAIFAIALWQMNAQNESQISSNTGGEQQERVENRQQMRVRAYENGAYTARGFYTSPAGDEEIEIVIELEDGIVTSAGFEGFATNPGSVRLQGAFAEGFEEEVVGKSIDEIELTVVNGSSLTPKGFNDALEKIKEEAAQG